MAAAGLALAAFAVASGSAREAPPQSSASRAGGAVGPRDALLKLIDRPRVPLAPEVVPGPAGGRLVHEQFSFASEARERVPGIAIRLAGPGRRPAVIVLHATGSMKESMTPLLQNLAERGFLAVAIDGRHHGERESLSGQYANAMLQTYRTGQGRPFLFDTVWDVMRLVDYLTSREDVNPAATGMIGVSKGGIETYLTAAIDPRIAVAVPVIGVQSFRWGLEHDFWQPRVGTFQPAVDGAARDAGVAPVDAAFVRRFYDKVAPGIYGQFDGPVMLPLIAPRPLLVISGDSDPRTPLPGVQDAAAGARVAYRDQRAEDRFSLLIQQRTGHAFGAPAQQAALEWLVRWLKP